MGIGRWLPAIGALVSTALMIDAATRTHVPVIVWVGWGVVMAGIAASYLRRR